MSKRLRTEKPHQNPKSELTKGLSSNVKDLLDLGQYLRKVAQEVKMITDSHETKLPSVPKPPTETEQHLPKPEIPWDAGLSWDMTRFYHEAARDFGTDTANSPDFWDIGELPDPAKTGKDVN